MRAEVWNPNCFAGGTVPPLGIISGGHQPNLSLYLRWCRDLRDYPTTSTHFPLTNKPPPLSLFHLLLRYWALWLYRTLILACVKIPPTMSEEMKNCERVEYEWYKGVETSRKICFVLSTRKMELRGAGIRTCGGNGI